MEHATPQTIADLQKLAEYRRSRQNIFPSDQALQWFVRQHRAELVQARALVMLVGQWHAEPNLFDEFVLAAGQRAAQRRMKAA